MRRFHTFLLAAALAVSACSSDSISGLRQNTQPAGPQVTTVTLLGIVVQHPQGELWLLRSEGDIQLVGAIEALLPHIGREVEVAGRFVDSGAFWVDFVRPIISGPPQ